MKKQQKGMVYIILAAALWGFFPSFNRVLYENGVSVLEASAARAFVAGGVYLIWGLLKGTFRGIRLRDLPFFLFYGIAAILSTYVFYALAIEHLSSAMAAILLYTAPAFVILFSRIFYEEPITKVKAAALCLTFCGSFLVVRGYDISSLRLNGLGILFGLLSGVSYAMLTVIGRKGLQKYEPMANTFLPTILTAVIFLGIVPPWTISVPNMAVAVCFLGVGIIGSVLPYFFYLKGLGEGLDGGSASILANIEPLVATLCGVVFFHDPLEIWQVLGIAVTLYGAVLPVVPKKRVSSGGAEDKKE